MDLFAEYSLEEEKNYLDFEMKRCFDCLNACLPLSLRVCKWRWRIIDWDGGGVGCGIQSACLIQTSDT